MVRRILLLLICTLLFGLSASNGQANEPLYVSAFTEQATDKYLAKKISINAMLP